MKIDTQQMIHDLEGEVVQLDNGIECTLGRVCCRALLGNYRGEEALPGEDKYARWELAGRISKGGEVELTVEEVAQVKMLIGKGFTTLVVGAAYHLLEQKG